MNRQWKFPPSRILDALLIVFAINAVLVVWTVVSRHATADALALQEPSTSQPDTLTSALQTETVEQPNTTPTLDDPQAEAADDSALLPRESLPADELNSSPPLLSNSSELPNPIGPPNPNRLPNPTELQFEQLPATPTLESLQADPQFQEFRELAAEQFPAPELSVLDLGSEPATDATLTRGHGVAASQPIASDELRELEERLLVVDNLNQAALRLARIAHRHAAANRTEQCQQALRQSQQLRAMSAELLAEE